MNISVESLLGYLLAAATVGLVTAVIKLWGMHMAHTRHVAEQYVRHEALKERLEPLNKELSDVKMLAQQILQTVSELKGKYQGTHDGRNP